jgi:hypothetical protein
MKQIFKIFFLLLLASGHAQEKVKKDSKKNLTKSQNLEISYLELKSPMNLVQCKNCISENPTIDLKELNDDNQFINSFIRTIKYEFIAFDFVFDKYGKIIDVNYNKNYNNSFYASNNEDLLNNLLAKLKGKKLFVENLQYKQSVKATLSFIIDNDKLILNPITHK